MTYRANWTPLTEIGYVDKYSPKPRGIRFLNGWSEELHRGWISVLRATTQWLVMTGKLTEENARIRHRDLRDFWVTFNNTETHQPKGTRIRKLEHIGSGVYINKNWKAEHCVSGAIGLLEHFDEDLDGVVVFF